MQTRLSKRIPVEEKTWAQLSRLKEPGETFDDLLNRLMENEAGMRLSRELRKLEQEEKFVEFA
jgi:predicted CopG family antitoxin